MQIPQMVKTIIPLTILLAPHLPVDFKQMCEAALYGPDELDKMNPEELARYLELLRANWTASYSE